LRAFYGGTPEAIAAYAKGAPLTIANPEALRHEKQASRAR
jgi:hypothetical protein